MFKRIDRLTNNKRDCFIAIGNICLLEIRFIRIVKANFEHIHIELRLYAWCSGEYLPNECVYVREMTISRLCRSVIFEYVSNGEIVYNILKQTPVSNALSCEFKCPSNEVFSPASNIYISFASRLWNTCCVSSRLFIIYKCVSLGEVHKNEHFGVQIQC